MERKDSHHAAGVWQADLISVAALAVLVAAVYFVDFFVQPVFSPASLLATGVFLALVPAVIWIAFFYRRDRLEPEPKTLIFQVFLLGGLLAAAIGIPLLDNVFAIDTWLNRSTWSFLLGAVLIIGVSQEFLKYAAVRYTVYNSREFNEPIDGIIYATATGLGFATVLNIAFVINSGGVALGAGVLRMTFVALAHASFSGVMGYFLGTGKFTRKPVWWVPAGLAAAAVLNGSFYFLRSMVTKRAIGAAGVLQPWLGFLLAAALAVLVTSFLSRAIRQHHQAQALREDAS